MCDLRLFGAPKIERLEAVKAAFSHTENIYAALMDETALWDMKTLEIIMDEFPSVPLSKVDFYLVLTECLSNAALHGRAEFVGLFARYRHGIFLLSFFQFPPLPRSVISSLGYARRIGLPDILHDISGGLGFPILLRLARTVTITSDRAKLQLWFRFKKPQQ